MVVGIPVVSVWLYIVWNNQDMRKVNKSFFHRKYHDTGIWNEGDLLRFDLNNMESYELIAKELSRMD